MARAQELLDSNQPEAALALLKNLGKKNPRDAEALLTRSTAHFMVGHHFRGVADLDSALALDPNLRQGWLNKAALAIADRRYPEAQIALEKAKKLDPKAADNYLNLGAVLLFQGKLSEATENFETYLATQPDSAEAHYLVASNYALEGYINLTIKNLQKAFSLAERYRLRARTDPNFDPLANQSSFQELLTQDFYRLPAGAYQAHRTYPLAYNRENGKLLGHVIDALRDAHIRFDPRIEATEGWALIWGDLRIKVKPGKRAGANAGANAGASGGASVGDRESGTIEVSAPAERFSPGQWRQLTDNFFSHLDLRLGS
ncbi:MAG: tetratricopeptide repeat protein [Deltaproteobacteria bacterium]|nr:tetratricopeptide repeat protein [Deltaproteobacteria bacterium]